MKKTRSKILCALAALLGVFFVFACVAGFAACGDGEPETYRFEVEDAKLDGDESEMLYWLDNEVFQGSYITGFGFIFDVQEDETASGGESVGYLAHNNPTATFTINSKKAVSGATLTLRAASCDVNTDGISSVFGLMVTGINSYSGADHNILSVNGQSVALSGTLEGSESVFADEGLAMSNWGTLTATIDLVKGDNTIVLTHDGAGVNWDYIEIESTAALSMDKSDNSGFTVDKGTYEPDEDESGSGNQGGGQSGDTGSGSGNDDVQYVTDRFVLGAYDATTSTKDYYYYKDSVSQNEAYFTGSEVTSVTYEKSTDTEDGIDGTYTINGNASNMDAEQLAAFWGAGASEHAGAVYLTVTLLAKAGEQITVYTAKSPDGISLNGDSQTLDDTFFTRIQDVTDYTEGGQLYTFSDGDGTYAVVLGDIIKYEPVKLEAEDAAWINASGKKNEYLDFSNIGGGIILQSGMMDTEVLDESDSIESIKFFKQGDQLVFAVYSDEAVSNVTIAINAASAATISFSGSGDFTDSAEGGLLTVNGMVTPVSGTLTYDSNKMYHNWTELTATISLIEGVNYFVLTCGSTSINVDGLTLYCANVDLNEVLSDQDVATNLTYISESMDDGGTTLKLEAEDAGLFNTIGKTNEYLDLGFMKTQTSGVMDTECLDDVTTSIKYFKEGDKIVFAVYADEAMSNVSIAINAASAATTSTDGSGDFTDATEGGLLAVNGTVVPVAGTLAFDSSKRYYNWGELTATISLVEGVNYIVLTCGSTSINVDGITLTFNSVTVEP